MGALVSIKLPDIGDFENVEVIEVMVKPGDKVKVDDSLITIESDKASMEVPATETGVVKELKVKVGDRVSEGSPIIVVETTDETAKSAETYGACQSRAAAPPESTSGPPKLESVPPRAASAGALRRASQAGRIGQRNPARRGTRGSQPPGASRTPVRRCASSRANSASISPRSRARGLNGRIFRGDVQAFVKSAMAQERQRRRIGTLRAGRMAQDRFRALR